MPTSTRGSLAGASAEVMREADRILSGTEARCRAALTGLAISNKSVPGFRARESGAGVKIEGSRSSQSRWRGLSPGETSGRPAAPTFPESVETCSAAGERRGEVLISYRAGKLEAGPRTQRSNTPASVFERSATITSEATFRAGGG